MRSAITIIFVVVTTAVAQVCENGPSVELTNRSYNGITYYDGEYFVDNATGVERGCVCMKELCARKCCPYGQAYDAISKLCVNVPDKFHPPVWDESQLLPGFNATKEFHFLFYKMNCTGDGESRISIGGHTLGFHMVKNGSLQVHIDETTVQMYGPDKYCIDNFVIQDPSSNESSVELNALICFVPTKVENHYGLSSSCMLISCFFIILTVGVYAWLPELRNLHGMVLMAYLLSFFVGFTFLAAMQILLLWNHITTNMCTGFTFIIYYSLLAAFFWMNVMCYDIWWTFSGKRSLSGRKSSVRSRFVAYSLYAFGVPTALTVLLAVLEFAIDPEMSIFLPRLRLQGCFLYGKSKLIYLYTPIIVLCLSNLVFFTLTAIKIAEIKRQTLVLNQKDKQRFSLYIKLFILMGVNWILEVISSFYPDHDNIWKFTDAYNVLVGLIIFIIFVCKKKTLEKIKHRYKHLMGHPLSRTQTTSTSISTRTISKDEIQLNATSIKK